MPTYEYVCTECDHQFEAFQSIKADPLSDCPKCGKSSAKRQISLGAGFVLKGGGWYSDLYGSSGGSAGASSDGDKATSTAKSSTESSGSSDGASGTGSENSSSTSSSDD